MSRWMWPLVLAVACSSHHEVHAPIAPTAHAALPDGAPLITPGERMSYKLALQGFELAMYDFVAGDVAPVGGKSAIVVQAHARTVGLVAAAVKVDDYFSSWIDVATGRPLRFTCDEFANNGTDKERTDVDISARTADSLPVMFHLNDTAPQPEPQHISQPEVWDYVAFLIALRAWEAPANTAISAEVLRSRFLWHVDMKVHGKDKLLTQLGELPALRLDGHTYKLDRNGGKAPNSDERDFSVWISDDDGRVPLQVVAKTDYGDIKMEIVDYAPGSGQRLRK